MRTVGTLVLSMASLLALSCAAESTATANGGTTGGVAALLNTTCSGACNAATPTSPVPLDNGALGNVTMYATSASRGGACLYGETGVMYYAAMSVNVEPGDALGQWQEGRICGQCAKVVAVTSQGLTEVVVRIMDKCPDGDCGIDLGGSAPDVIMLDGYGRYDGAWEFVSCAGHSELFDGETSLYVKDGSNAYWSAVQVRNPPMSVTAMHWHNQTAGTSGSLEYSSPQIENYYFVPVEVLQANATIELTVVYRDESTDVITLTSAQLAQAETTYAF
jgi:expansin (peptidoglycan-binding protein)